jgi:hypothetical protein
MASVALHFPGLASTQLSILYNAIVWSQTRTFHSSQTQAVSFCPMCHFGCARQHRLRWSPRRSTNGHPVNAVTVWRCHWGSQRAGVMQKRWQQVSRSWRCGWSVQVFFGEAETETWRAQRGYGELALPRFSPSSRNEYRTTPSAPPEWWLRQAVLTQRVQKRIAGVLAAPQASTDCAQR